MFNKSLNMLPTKARWSITIYPQTCDANTQIQSKLKTTINNIYGMITNNENMMFSTSKYCVIRMGPTVVNVDRNSIAVLIKIKVFPHVLVELNAINLASDRLVQ